MVRREKLKAAPAPPSIRFCGSGCTVLDQALGGGWAEGRISNVIGDRSTGKTLVAMEAMTNFGLAHPTGSLHYRESEHAFDEHYARALGMPFERVSLAHLDTVEAFYDDLSKVVDKAKKPAFYVLDSLDALGDVHEQERGFRAATYGTDKAAALSELFRRRVGDMANADVTLMIVSQIRSRIGGYGKEWVRAGGRALDFYASQIVFLRQTGMVTREVKGVKRVTGITVRARLEKNKIGLPFREAEFELIFGYGMDDWKACVAYLDHTKALNGDKPQALLKALRDGDPELRARTRERVAARWAEIETSFLPTSRKY
jgi:recombination protein RecA